MLGKAQIAAMFGVFALLVLLTLVFFLLTGSETDASVDYPKYIKKLVTLSGKSNSSCPELPVPDKDSASVSCIREAVDSKKPFWLSIGPVGEHSNAWVGFARNSKGQLWRVFFQKDVTAGYGDNKKPYLGVGQCQDILFFNTLSTPPDCTNRL